MWAIPTIRRINPDVDLSVFPFPTTNDVDHNRLVYGMDILLTMPREATEHAERL